VDLWRPARQAVETCRQPAGERGLTVTLRIPTSTSPVYADAGRIEQVFTNLLGNAVKFTPAGGTVTIGARESGEEVVVSVADTGVGIAPENSTKVFDRFLQLDRQAGAGARGMGLGLAICREIVSRHGGKIWVESDLAKGSTFLFTLPKAQPHLVLKQEIASAIERAEAEGVGLAVLLVRVFAGEADESAAGQRRTRAMLEEVSRAVKASVRAVDAVLPLGEDLVASLLLGVDRSRVEDIAGVLQEHIGARRASARMPAGSAVALAVATYPEDGAAAAELLETANERLHTGAPLERQAVGPARRR